MPGPGELLDSALAKAVGFGAESAISDRETQQRIEYICRCRENRAGVRFVMSCVLAKTHRPEVDPRGPYTEIGGEKSFSGRTYDEQYITNFIIANRLPCNTTTAFLTPTFRNHSSLLTTDTELVGRPREMYVQILRLLDDVANGRVAAELVLVETLRVLLAVRDEDQERLGKLLDGLKRSVDSVPLSAERIVVLLQQHLACKHSSRLPVLIVAAAYQAVSLLIGEFAKPLKGHLAADKQTGASGDLEVRLVNEDRVCTVYEMKSKRVTVNDIDLIVNKIATSPHYIDNYVVISTDTIEPKVVERAAAMYEQTRGIEIIVLDCIGFVRHYLHFFHRYRVQFLDAYQALVLNEPDSAVRQSLKEAFLSLRRDAESD